MDSAFSGCTSLESIDLTNFEAPLLTNMNNAFFHCSSLKGIDLSYINSSSITFINRIFCGCNSLKSLNLANLNLTNIKDASYAFYNLKNLQFLNILGIEVNDIFKSELFGQYGLNEEKPMAICQNEEEKMITNPNYQYICCNYDNDNNGCECSNNIIIYYKDKTEYTTGFIYGSGKTEIETRKDITYLYADDDIYNITFPFNTSKNSYVKLCFKSPISSLENFFNSDEESSESNNIRSIDLSHFDSSSLNNVRNIFHNCKGLVALDMSNLNFLNVDGFSTMFNNNND
jgi:surface protein